MEMLGRVWVSKDQPGNLQHASKIYIAKEILKERKSQHLLEETNSGVCIGMWNEMSFLL